MNATTSHRPRLRKVLRISLRSLFVIVAVLSICLATHIHRAKQQSQIVESIRQSGGSVDYYLSEQEERASRITPALIRMLGDDFFRKPVGVSFRGKQVTDEVLSDIARLPHLKALSFSDVSVTDNGLLKLSTLGMDDLFYLRCYRDARNEPVYQELSKEWSWDCSNLDLQGLCDELAIRHGVKFRFDSVEFERAGIDEFNTMFSFSKKGVSFGGGLADVLGQHELGWLVDGGEILITSKTTAESNRRIEDRIRLNMPALRQLNVDWGQ